MIRGTHAVAVVEGRSALSVEATLGNVTRVNADAFGTLFVVSALVVEGALGRVRDFLAFTAYVDHCLGWTLTDHRAHGNGTKDSALLFGAAHVGKCAGILTNCVHARLVRRTLAVFCAFWSQRWALGVWKLQFSLVRVLLTLCFP